MNILFLSVVKSHCQLVQSSSRVATAYPPPQEMNVQVTFIERSPDARERHLDVSRTFPDARLADVSELLNFTYAFKCNYHQKCKLASL